MPRRSVGRVRRKKKASFLGKLKSAGNALTSFGKSGRSARMKKAFIPQASVGPPPKRRRTTRKRGW